MVSHPGVERQMFVFCAEQGWAYCLTPALWQRFDDLCFRQSPCHFPQGAENSAEHAASRCGAHMGFQLVLKGVGEAWAVSIVTQGNPAIPEKVGQHKPLTPVVLLEIVER